jgi:bacteriorhodopsin
VLFNAIKAEEALRMTPETAAKLQKVKKYSASLRNLFRFFFVSVILGWFARMLVAWTGPKPSEPDVVEIAHLVFTGDSVPAEVRVIAYAYFTLGLAISLKIFFHLIKLFALYAQGKIFDAENVHQIRQVGYTILISPILWLLTLFIPLFIATDGVTVATSPNLGLNIGGVFNEVILGTIILVVSWIMDVGRELREEQDLVV